MHNYSIAVEKKSLPQFRALKNKKKKVGVLYWGHIQSLVQCSMLLTTTWV